MRHDHKFPRTLRQAFGHYTGEWLIDSTPVNRPADKAVFIACLVAGAVSVLFL